MAVAGSGGWIPSRYVLIRDGRLRIGDIAQNKPKSIVYEDMRLAADALAGMAEGDMIQVDTRGVNLQTLRLLLQERGVVRILG